MVWMSVKVSLERISPLLSRQFLELASGPSDHLIDSNVECERTFSRAKMIEICPELTLLRSYGDAALSHVNPGESLGEGFAPGSP